MTISKSNARKRVISPPEVGEDVSDRPKKQSRGRSGWNLFTQEFILGANEGLKGSDVVTDPDDMMTLAAYYWNDPNEDWKNQYPEKVARARKNLLTVSKQKKESKQVQTSLRTRCSPKLLVFHNMKLTKAQRDAIEKLNPFHSLVNLKCNWLHRGYVMKLVERFNPETRTIEFCNGRRCLITEDDFARVLGMPKGDIPVPWQCNQQHRDKIALWFKKDYKEAHKCIKLSVLRGVLLKEECDEKFQLAYMLFALGCFLCPTTKDAVGSRLFSTVATDNLETMRSYKWPKFVLDWLVDEVRSYKHRVKSNRSCFGAGVGGCLLGLMIIYFDRFRRKVRIVEEGHPLIALWTNDLIRKRIRMEVEDGPTKKSVLAQFPPHGLHDPSCIKAYEDNVRQFLINWKNLRAIDARLIEKEKVPTRLHIQEDEEQKGEEEEKGDEDEENRDDINFIDDDEEENGDEDDEDDEDDDQDIGDGDEDDEEENGDDDEEDDDEHKGDEDDEEQSVHEDSHEEDGEAGETGADKGFTWETPLNDFQQELATTSSRRRDKGQTSTTSSRPTRRRGNRKTKQSQSTQAPYVSKPAWTKEKMTAEKKKIVEFLLRRPTRTNESKICIKFVGAKWPLDFQDVYQSFSPRGLVSNIVLHTVRDWMMLNEMEEKDKGKLHPKRHIFPPEFASNLLKYNGGKFRSVLKDECDLKKLGYNVTRCNLLIFPVLADGHWFCIVISLVDVRVDVLDSLMPVDRKDRLTTVMTIRDNFFALLGEIKLEVKHSSKEFAPDFQYVPQQKNSHDCGIYVLKFMESWKGKLASAELEIETLDNIRKFMLIKLFMDPRNTQRDSVMKAMNMK